MLFGQASIFPRIQIFLIILYNINNSYSSKSDKNFSMLFSLLYKLISMSVLTDTWKRACLPGPHTVASALSNRTYVHRIDVRILTPRNPRLYLPAYITIKW